LKVSHYSRFCTS